MYYVYILRSIKTARYYIGATENLARRLIEHNFAGVDQQKLKDHGK